MNVSAIMLASLLMVGQAPEKPTLSQRPSAQPAVEESARSDDPPPMLKNCVVTLIHDVRVPARESGLLVAMDAKKGTVVAQGDVLGKIDDSDALVRKIMAENELSVAETQAASDANLKAALATIDVAQAEYDKNREIKARVTDAVSSFEIRRLKLTAERSVYQADNAQVEHEVNQLTRSVQAGQLKAVENEIERKQIVSPVNGVVVDRFRNVGEWAEAGEPIFRVIHMDRLRVEGMVNADQYMPEDILGSTVTIYVQLPGGRFKEIEATIDFVHLVVDPSGDFLIHAEFDNPRKPNGQWEVRPGLDAEIRQNWPDYSESESGR